MDIMDWLMQNVHCKPFWREKAFEILQIDILHVWPAQFNIIAYL
jgi:hypothetical protein